MGNLCDSSLTRSWLGVRRVLWTLMVLLTGTCCGTSGSGVILLDLDGRSVAPLEDAEALASVFIFTSVDCPVSNRYAPEMQRLKAEFADHGVAFWLVYPNPVETPAAIGKHLKDYGYDLGALRDPEGRLVDLAGASVTPEAAVFVPRGGLVYRGRIDDRYMDFGKARAHATKYDLEEVLKSLVAGEPVTPRFTKAIGCYISDMRR